MYICVCKGVSVKDVEEAMKTVGNSIEQVRNTCGAGTDCGACRTRLEKFMSQNPVTEQKTSKSTRRP